MRRLLAFSLLVLLAPSTDPAGRNHKGPRPFSEPETVALRDLVLETRPLFVVDLHSPGKVTRPNVVFWPWLFREEGRLGPDAPVYRGIARAFAARTETEVDGVFYDGDGYAFDTLPKEQCWVYRETGICVLLVEISSRFWWEGPIVDTIAERVAEGMFALLDRALDGPGLLVRVQDAATGRPLEAEVRVEGRHDGAIGPRRTRAGLHRRLLDPGPASVTVLPDGRAPVTRRVEVAPEGWTRLEVAVE